MGCFVTEGLRTVCGGPFSFSVARGECLALSGPSGCGKTLLLRAIADLDPAAGDVLLDNVSRNEIPAPDWRRQVGWLPAESSWWADHIGAHFPAGGKHHTFEGVMFPDLGKTDGDFSNDWKKAGGHFQTLERLGFPRDVLGWRVERLSTGEKQRLALFRLLLNKPKVLLLDEPTAALDPVNGVLVENLIRDYQQDAGAAVVWVSHNPEQIARVADRHLIFSGNGLEAAQ